MPGPKMGPRPKDFDEGLVRRSPTFRKWEGLLPGGKLRYACRDFVKGQGDDEERLMRRIMIARRNNVRDHHALKWARRMQSSVIANGEQPLPDKDPIKEETATNKKRRVDSSGFKKSRAETEAIISRTSLLLPVEQEPPRGRRTRRPTTLISEEAIREEMDVAAVEKTRSYKTWMSLPDGAEFLYNQKYIKGNEAHDWLLKKNIWRRMRYRRENKKMVDKMLLRERSKPSSTAQPQQSRKRCHDKTGVSSTAMDLNTKIVGSNENNVAIGDRTTAPTAVGILAGTNETNRVEVVASTASEIVDHALLSTNTAARPIVPGANSPTGNSISLSIGDSDQQQQLQNDTSLTHPLHHHQQHESAAAFAASIALAGVGIGTGGDLTSHHDAAVADSAAVQAAVVAALAATDVDSSSYHNNQHHALMDFDHVVHGGNDSLVSPAKTREGDSHSVLPSTTASMATVNTATSTTTQASPTSSSQDGVVTGLGLALDAAAKLAAAAAVDTCDSVKNFLLPTTAITAAVEPVIPVGKASGDGMNEGDDTSPEAADESIDKKSQLA